MFDVPVADLLTREWIVDSDHDAQPWSVGCIVGPSGSGKSTMARKIFGDLFASHEFPTDAAVVDGFPQAMQVNDICGLLSQVGFSSPPSWMLPYRMLSNGQQFRAQLAYALATNDKLIFDEFTSVVDRTVAKACATCVAKYARKHAKQFVAVTCHYDIMEWMEPDWIIDMADCSFQRRSLHRPKLSIEVRRASTAIWPMFAPHHYLSADIHKAAHVYAAIMEGRIVAMCADIHFCHPHVNNMRRIHRLVTLPDFQGFGIGPRLACAVGQINAAERKRTSITTSHPGLIRSLDKLTSWKLTRQPSMTSISGTKGIMHSKGAKNPISSFGRMCSAFEYVGGVGTPPMAHQ